MWTIAQDLIDVNGKDRCPQICPWYGLFSLLLFGMEFALIFGSMRLRRIFFLFCALCYGVCSLGGSTVQKPKKFVFGISAGIGHWTSQAARDVLIIPLPTFPEDYGVVVAETDTSVNSHFGFNFTYNFTPRFGLQAEFSRINAEYMFLIGLNSRYPSDRPLYDPVNLPWKVTTVYINGVFSFLKDKGKVFPFAFAGAGFNILQKNSVSGEYVALESESTMDLGLKLGGGFEFYPGGSPLGFDLRGFILYLTDLGMTRYDYQSYTSPTPGFAGENLVWAVDLGIKFRF